VFWVAVIVRAAIKLVRLAGPNWRQQVVVAQADERTGVLG
jgi:hypothetical protein